MCEKFSARRYLINIESFLFYEKNCSKEPIRRIESVRYLKFWGKKFTLTIKDL